MSGEKFIKYKSGTFFGTSKLDVCNGRDHFDVYFRKGDNVLVIRTSYCDGSCKTKNRRAIPEDDIISKALQEKVSSIDPYH